MSSIWALRLWFYNIYNHDKDYYKPFIVNGKEVYNSANHYKRKWGK